MNISETKEIEFSLEKDIQKLIENNIKTIFGLEFITSEFQINDLRIDTLAFDSESKSFTIIEYKKGKNFSVIDQGFAYLSLLLNNKAEFILIYNEKYHLHLKKDDFDWSQSKVIFVSPSFTIYQKKAIEFRDLPIDLWEIKLYADNTLLINRIETVENKESINKLNPRSEIIRSVNKEIRVYTEQEHFSRSTEGIVSLYDELKEAILSISSGVKLEAKAKYIGFVRNKHFVDVIFYKESLLLILNVKKGFLNDPKKVAKDVSQVGHWGNNGDYSIKLQNSTDLGYVLTLIRQAYDLN
jgi:predicted transport protein